MELKATIENTVEVLLEKKRFNTLRDILVTMNPADIAVLIERLQDQKSALLFRLLPKELAAEGFVEMEPDAQEMLIKSLSDSELKDIVDELYMDDAVDLVEEMPANVVNRILTQADPETRKLINELLKYPEDSAGSIMTTEFIGLCPDMTASEAIDHIRATGIDKETINVCYITDNKRGLIGAASIKSIIFSDKDARLGDIMEPHVISVNTMEDQETVVQLLQKYNFTALPVVDTENRLVGIITIDDAIDVMQEEATEDIEKMAAITPSDKPYLKLTVFEIWKSRIPWLMLLMVSATFTGMIITHFEDALSRYVVLTSFIPMLMDTGGNSGTQASVTIIRGLSLNEIKFGDIFRVVWKEIRVAVLCGLSLAAVNFVKIVVFNKVTMGVAFVVCATLALTVLMAKTVGCMLPMVTKKMGFDPAVMASPILTTIVDAMALLIYFRIATTLLAIV